MAAKLVEKNCLCDECRRGCTRRPGWFMPGEATKLAATLGMTLVELFTRYLVIDSWYELPSDILLLAPAWPPSARPGTTASWSAVFRPAPCVFFGAQNGGLCTIYENRPAECRVSYHDADKRSYNDWREHHLVQAWRRDHVEIDELLIERKEGESRK